MKRRLTDAEIAELRATFGLPVRGVQMGVLPVLSDEQLITIASVALPSLLDEVEDARRFNRLGSVCPHGGTHAPYCVGCCAKFDPGRMVLIHEATCRLLGHERATE